jgi:hypothetical protein
VCVLALLLASSTYSEAQLAALQSASPAAIEASGRFSLLKALCIEARVDYGKAKVRAHIFIFVHSVARCQSCFVS